VILLVEDVDPTGTEGFAVLTKPVEGNDLIDMVQAFSARHVLAD